MQTKQDSIAFVLSHIDNAIQYGEDVEPKVSGLGVGGHGFGFGVQGVGSERQRGGVGSRRQRGGVGSRRPWNGIAEEVEPPSLNPLNLPLFRFAFRRGASGLVLQAI